MESHPSEEYGVVWDRNLGMEWWRKVGHYQEQNEVNLGQGHTKLYFEKGDTREGNTNKNSEENVQVWRRSKKFRQEVSERIREMDRQGGGREKSKCVGRKKKRIEEDTGNQWGLDGKS